jgi:hypothetical protein
MVGSYNLGKAGSTLLNIGTFPAGVYLLRSKTANGVVAKRLIIQK